MARWGDFHECPWCGKKQAYVSHLEYDGMGKHWRCRACGWSGWESESLPLVGQHADAVPSGGRSRGALDGEE